MKPNCRNIYFNARQAAGYTQERWAEMIGVSVEAVRQYETGKILPSDDVAMRMAELTGVLILGYWHLREKSKAAAAMLPDVQRVPLAQAAIRLITRIRAFTFDQSETELLYIAEDGTITDAEREQFEAILEKLEDIVEAALTLRYAEYDELD